MAPNAKATIAKIKQEKIGAQRKRALIVEGVDDVFAVSSFLTKKNPQWERDWVIAPAGKKSRVIEILQQEESWIGIVDRDEWQQDVIDEQSRNLPNLWVLPRFCIESYLVIPEELWATLPPRQQARLTSGLPQLQTPILQDLNRWVAHGVLWSVINPLWEGLRSRGFKEKLLEPAIATDEAKIRSTLEDWHRYLNPDALLQQHKTRLEEISTLPATEQLTRWVHGKLFYKNVVAPTLNTLFGQRDAKIRTKDLFTACPVPKDFDTLWPMLGFTN